jgi:Clustered mitochondria
LKRKQYSREFNANERVFDAIYLTSNSEASYKVRNPLQVMIDYKGFRALATAVVPINPALGMSLGFDIEGKLHNLDEKLKAELQYIADVLNLEETKTRVKKSNIVLVSSLQEELKQEVDIQLFEGLPLSNSIKVYEQTEGYIPNLMSLKHSQLKKMHKSLLKNCYIEQLQYILKTHDICPFDVDHRAIQSEIERLNSRHNKTEQAVKTSKNQDGARR